MAPEIRCLVYVFALDVLRISKKKNAPMISSDLSRIHYKDKIVNILFFLFLFGFLHLRGFEGMLGSPSIVTE